MIVSDPFCNRLLWWLDAISLRMQRPFIYFLHEFTSCFSDTTQEQKFPWRRLGHRFILAPFFFLFTWLTLPISFLGFSIWWITNLFRRQPFLYSTTRPCERDVPNHKLEYCFATTNVCLLPEFVARFNNQAKNRKRAFRIGRRIIHQKNVALSQNGQSVKGMNNGHGTYISNSSLSSTTSLSSSSSSFTLKNMGNSYNLNGGPIHPPQERLESSFNHDIIVQFPSTDFLLIQETFDPACAEILLKELHQRYPYIIYDVADHRWAANHYVTNSGIMFASRYPILDATFNFYPTSYALCRLACKGVLQVKVLLGRQGGGAGNAGHDTVGYLFLTHLQAYQGNHPIHSQQLDKILEWSREFRQATLKPHENVAFDILGGDFNLDNLSPVDEEERCHAVFREYCDVGRVRPGVEHDWIVGTEMRHRPFHDELVSTPEGLKQALEDPLLRQHYILDADIQTANLDMATDMPRRDKHGNPILNPVGGKRRIDLLLYRHGDGVEVKAYNFVTLLAGLTDHIPVAMTIKTAI